MLDEDTALCEAVERDLIGEGLRLRWLCDGTDRLNWRDLWVCIRLSREGSAVAAYFDGESAGWSMDTHLLAYIGDLLAGANWQRGGGKGDKPKPIPRPGSSPSVDEPAAKPMGGRDFEVEEMSAGEAAAWMGIDLPS